VTAEAPLDPEPDANAMQRLPLLVLATLLLSAVSAAGLAGARTASQDSPAGRVLPLDGVELYFEERGAGPPLLLLHYFGGCARSWDPHVEALARHYRLVVPDLRGHGRSTLPSGAFTHREAARDVLALLDALGIERTRAMGMSSGGMTLLHAATQAPERLEAMVLIGATTHFPEQARAIMRRAVPEQMEPGELAQWAACAARGDEQTRAVIGLFHGMKDSYDDMTFTPPHLATITARTLIVHGDRDEFFPVDIAAGMYASIPHAYLWIVPNGDHIPVFGEAAEPFRELALEFLTGEWDGKER
jgi:pimeloyl-ACP methyl ester carboxylesterase